MTYASGSPVSRDLVEHRQHARRARRRAAGPLSAPTAADIAAPQSAPVEAVMRAVKVEALSAVLGGADPVGVDRLARGPGRPRRASAGGTSPRRSCPGRPRRPGRLAPVGDRGRLRDDRHHLRREPGEIVARLLVVDVDSFLRPHSLERRAVSAWRSAGRVAGQRRRLVRLRGRACPGSKLSSTRRPQTCS